ncbi:MAG: ParB/RepB/Spo0J family partition protein [Sphingomonas sp.]|uniref:ParB/RepB/Spo0J family partition protein n=1 Tax=Sphingomonas sp. TaxID=28214 RepID=UPI001AFEB942|nr:ParB/RepB/Spo0J family partition protein [Sphingomonas sp.]MBO9622809.1 ParB/RepB/Spo0J family partition protein [Sphingomonas sp.]
MPDSNKTADRDVTPAGDLRSIEIKEILPNPRNPRQTFNPRTIERLAASMEEIGLQVPITVYRSPDRPSFILLDGERRFRAAQSINWKTIPALVVAEPSSNENAVRMFNIHMLREEWEEIETAWALEQIIDETGLTSDRDLQRITGLSIDRIRNMRRVLSYPRETQERVAAGEIKYQLLVELDKNVSSKLRRESSEGQAPVPGLTADKARNELLKRYDENVEADVVNLRLVGTLFDTAKSEGKVGERARSALSRLFTEPDLSIDEAYELGAASNVELGKVLRDIAALPGRISDFLAITTDADQRGQLREALLELRLRVDGALSNLS